MNSDSITYNGAELDHAKRTEGHIPILPEATPGGRFLGPLSEDVVRIIFKYVRIKPPVFLETQRV